MTDAGLPLEEFIQALTSQLDRTQEALAMKAQAGLPMTFAVKDISLDLRAQVEMQDSVVRIRPAGPGDASVLHLELSTITRPMIEENTRPTPTAQETSLREALGEDLTDEDERRLEWAGIRSVEQLRALRERQGDAAIGRATRLPVQRLASRLFEASRPEIRDVRPEVDDGGRRSRLRIRGRNLLGAAPGTGPGGAATSPRIRLRGQPLELLEATDDEVVVALAESLGGVLEVTTDSGSVAVTTAEPPAHASTPAAADQPTEGGWR